VESSVEAPHARAAPPELFRAGQEGRCFLSRRRKALARASTACPVFYVSEDSPRKQLQQVLAYFDIRVAEDKLLSRCSKCNGLIVLAGEGAASRLEFVHPVRELWCCQKCGKLFWVGNQTEKAMGFLKSLLPGAPGSEAGAEHGPDGGRSGGLFGP